MGEMHMPTVLITGASRGLGLEFVTQYAGRWLERDRHLPDAGKS